MFILSLLIGTHFINGSDNNVVVQLDLLHIMVCLLFIEVYYIFTNTQEKSLIAIKPMIMK